MTGEGCGKITNNIFPHLPRHACPTPHARLKNGGNNACFEGLSSIRLSLLFFELTKRESKEQNFKHHIRVTTSAVWQQTISGKKWIKITQFVPALRTSALVVLITEFSFLTKLNKDNLELKHGEWIATTKRITDALMKHHCYWKNRKSCHLLLVTLLAKLLSIGEIKTEWDATLLVNRKCTCLNNLYEVLGITTCSTHSTRDLSIKSKLTEEMSFRHLTKVPKLCLVYFSIDKSTCVLETKKLRNNETREPFTENGPEKRAAVTL